MITLDKLNVKKKFSRNCPKCNNLIFHTDKGNGNRAIKNKQVCRNCTYKIFSEKYKGNGNPFFGKHHTKKSIKKIIENKDMSVYKTEEFRKKQSLLNSGKNNRMYGKSVYSIWLEKYGKEIADEKMREMKRKLSINGTGKNNGMYGKPSPNGAGQGWKGWYNNHFFRSLRELCYMIYLDENDIIWENGETNKFKVEYKDCKNINRTTRPDFFINNDTIVEIKPKKLQKTTSVILKRKAMEKFCKKNNYKYQMIDMNIDTEKIKKLYENKEVKFMDKYDEKFLEYTKD